MAALIPGVTSAETAEWRPGQELSANQGAKMVEEFASRVQTRWDTKINPADYEAVADNQGITVQPKGDDSVTVGSSDAQAELRQQNGSGRAAMSFDSKPEKPVATKDMKATQSPNWQNATCYGRWHVTTDISGTKFPVAWSDLCTRWGWIPAVQGRGQWVFKFDQTCRTEQSIQTWTLVSCTSGSVPTSNNMAWTEWTPKSDTPVGSCQPMTLSLTLGPISGSWTFGACDTIDIEKNAPPADFKVAWRGRAYDKDRSTSGLVAINVPADELPSIRGMQALAWDGCDGPAWDPCNDTQ